MGKKKKATEEGYWEVHTADLRGGNTYTYPKDYGDTWRDVYRKSKRHAIGDICLIRLVQEYYLL